MPIIELPPTAPKKETLAVRLEARVLDELRRYAAFLGTKNFSHIITRSLERVFKADAGYKAWLKTHPDLHPQPKTRGKGTVPPERIAARPVRPSPPSAVGEDPDSAPRISLGGE